MDPEMVAKFEASTHVSCKSLLINLSSSIVSICSVQRNLGKHDEDFEQTSTYPQANPGGQRGGSTKGDRQPEQDLAGPRAPAAGPGPAAGE